jgi:hypothetical protein
LREHKNDASQCPDGIWNCFTFVHVVFHLNKFAVAGIGRRWKNSAGVVTEFESANTSARIGSAGNYELTVGFVRSRAAAHPWWSHFPGHSVDFLSKPLFGNTSPATCGSDFHQAIGEKCVSDL